MHEVGLAGQRVGRRGAGGADRAHRLRVPVRQRALAGLGLRRPGCRSPRRTRAGRPRRRSSAPRRRRRSAAAAPTRIERRGPSAMSTASGRRPGDAPGPRREQLDRPVVRLGLHVLRQRDGHRPGLDRVGEHPHRAEQGRRQLLGPVDPVEEPRQRAEGVVDGDVARRTAPRAPAAPAPATRVAKVPEGSSSTGSRLIVASAAPVSMLVEPGPTEAVHAQVWSRSFCRA